MSSVLYRTLYFFSRAYRAPFYAQDWFRAQGGRGGRDEAFVSSPCHLCPLLP